MLPFRGTTGTVVLLSSGDADWPHAGHCIAAGVWLNLSVTKRADGRLACFKPNKHPSRTALWRARSTFRGLFFGRLPLSGSACALHLSCVVLLSSSFLSS
jgi:hypothetical protein